MVAIGKAEVETTRVKILTAKNEVFSQPQRGCSIQPSVDVTQERLRWVNV